MTDFDHATTICAGPEPDYRFSLANERTFLAWQRTALGLLAAAVAVVQLVPELGVTGLRYLLGVALAGLAVLAAGDSVRRWRQIDRAMRTGAPLPRHWAPACLAVGLIAIGLITIAALIAQEVAG